MLYQLWDGITYLFPNRNRKTIEIPHWPCDILFIVGLKLIHLSKRVLCWWDKSDLFSNCYIIMSSKTVNYQPSQFRHTDDTFWNICCDLFAICFCTLRPSHNDHHFVDYISTNQRVQRSLFLNVFSDSKVQAGKHGAHLGPIGPRWAPCWPHETCYLGYSLWACGIIYTPRNHSTIGSV